MTQGYFVLTFLILFFLIGTSFHLIDKKFGTIIYRLFYNATSKESLPEDVNRGVISFGRKSRYRFAAAGFFSFVQTVFAILSGNYNPFLEVATMFVEPFVIMLGFYSGDLVERLVNKGDPLFDRLDRIDAGEETVGHAVGDLSRALGERVRETADSIHVPPVFRGSGSESDISSPTSGLEETPRVDDTGNSSSESSIPEKEEELDVDDLLGRYSKGRRGRRDN